MGLILFPQFVRWQNSKRLLFGSLVCLSCNNFESFLFATVSDRDPKYLQKGQVQITFTEESRYKLARIPVRPFMVFIVLNSALSANHKCRNVWSKFVIKSQAEVEPKNRMNLMKRASHFWNRLTSCFSWLRPLLTLKLIGMFWKAWRNRRRKTCPFRGNSVCACVYVCCVAILNTIQTQTDFEGS